MQYRSYTGWLLSIYADRDDGVVLWVVGDDGTRKRLTQSLLTTFYVGGPQATLAAIANHLNQDLYRAHVFPIDRADLYDGPQNVLAIQTANPVYQQQLVRELRLRFRSHRPRFYDTAVPLSIRYAVAHGVFPTARCHVLHDDDNHILQICTDDTPWKIDYDLPGLRKLIFRPDVNPKYAQPRCIQVSDNQEQRTIPLIDPVQVLREVSSIVNRYDPDIILAQWGDRWLFPTLLEWAQEYRVHFNPSRDARHQYQLKGEITFETYGVVRHRAQQTFLYGREHLDPGNITVGEFSLHSTIELARVTALPIQVAGRNSPGAGFTAMQMAEALRRGVLVPEHKFQTEHFKSAAEFSQADNGGLNYRPVVGLHSHVAALDYFSMYASLMVTRNISGETVGTRGRKNQIIPGTDVPITQDFPGLVPSVLKPLLAKRYKVKQILKGLWEDDPEHTRLEAMADALKWLGYVSFGYQGFKHNLWGNIQAHEAITAFGREMLVKAIETSQELGYTILAANTDSLFVMKSGCSRMADFESLVSEINRRTGLNLMPEAMFDWLVFLPSKGNPQIGAVNRYFGRINRNKAKVRGLSQRRVDTPAWVVQAEIEAIRLLLAEPDGRKLKSKLPEVVTLMRKYIDELYQGMVPPSNLIVTRRLSRETEQFKGISEVASAAEQMRFSQRSVQVGEMVEYIYVRDGKPGVRSVDYHSWPEDSMIDKQQYCKLLMRAILQLLIPLGIRESDMPALAGEGVRQLRLFGGQDVRSIYTHVYHR
jgi:DNA polymerase-2